MPEIIPRTGTTSQVEQYIGKYGEIAVDADARRMVVYDGETRGGFPQGYIDRGDPVSLDFTALTIDGAWHDLDLSAIVPAGAKLVYLRVFGVDASVVSGDSIQFRKNGNVNGAAVESVNPQVNNIMFTDQVWVACDENRVIEYLINTALVSHGVVVLGWWI